MQVHGMRRLRPIDFCLRIRMGSEVTELELGNRQWIVQL